MKLRNKKTGEIVENAYIRESHNFYNKRTIAVFVRDGNHPPERVSTGYETLAELNEEWEDFEEPEMFYWIDYDGKICKAEIGTMDRTKIKQIGNYFEAREEAELAVRKLKAWKQLKDKGFRFDVVPALGHCDDEKFDISIIATMPAKWWYNDKVVDDIHYVFGGEE